MPGIDFDTSLFPLVEVTNHGGTTDADYQVLLGRFDELLRRREKFVVVTWATGDAFPSATQRKIIADWFPTVSREMPAYSLGCAMILQSTLQRGAITALNWLIKPDVPMAAFETRGRALTWCLDRLLEANVTMPPRVERALRGAA